MFGVREKQRGPLPGANGMMLQMTEGKHSLAALFLLSLFYQGKSCSNGEDIWEQIFWKKSKPEKLKKS